MKDRTVYSQEFKESFLAKVFAPNAPSIVELTKEHNLNYSTTYGWVHKMKKKQGKQTSTPKRPKDQTLEFKLTAIFETGPMTEEERSVYCRTHGLYAHNLEEWKTQILSEISNVDKNARAAIQKAKSDALQAESEKKQISKELHRKEKALAEVTALFVLKKKADLLWGEDEDD